MPPSQVSVPKLTKPFAPGMRADAGAAATAINATAKSIAPTRLIRRLICPPISKHDDAARPALQPSVGPARPAVNQGSWRFWFRTRRAVRELPASPPVIQASVAADDPQLSAGSAPPSGSPPARFPGRSSKSSASSSATAGRRTRKRGSGLSCGDDFADAAFRAALEQGDDVLAHPGTAHLARDAIGVFCARKGEYQDQVLLADHRDVGSDPAGIDDALDDVLQLVSSRLRERVAQAQVVDDDMHAADATGASDAERVVLSSTEGMLSPRGSGDSPAELGPVIAS